MRLLPKSGAISLRDSTSDWHPVENRRLLDLEFFNRIDPLQPLKELAVTGCFPALPEFGVRERRCLSAGIHRTERLSSIS